MWFHLNDDQNPSNRFPPSSVLEVEGGELRLYLDKEALGILDRSGFLNVVFAADNGESFVMKKKDFENSMITVKYQEYMKKIDTSTVVEIWAGKGVFGLAHWNGFESIVNLDNGQVQSQEFTK